MSLNGKHGKILPTKLQHNCQVTVKKLGRHIILFADSKYKQKLQTKECN